MRFHAHKHRIYGMPYGAGPLLKINPAAAPEDVTVEHVFVQSREAPEALPTATAGAGTAECDPR